MASECVVQQKSGSLKANVNFLLIVIFQVFAKFPLATCAASPTGNSNSNNNNNNDEYDLVQKQNYLNNAIEVDINRYDYMETIKVLWKFLNRTEPPWQATANVPMKLRRLYDAHTAYLQRHQLAGKRDNGNYQLAGNLTQNAEWHKLQRDLWRIENKFQIFKNCLVHLNTSGSADCNQGKFPLEFAERILRNDTHFSLPAIFASIDKLMVNNTLYYRVMTEMQDKICQLQQSQQQFVYAMYTDMALSELKGYMLLQFAAMSLHIHGRENYFPEAQQSRDDYEQRVRRAMRQMHEIMRHADQTLWQCDPPKFIKGESYDAVTRLLQGYIEHEINMNARRTCFGECHYHTMYVKPQCASGLFCERQSRCSGTIYDCQSIQDMYVCKSSRRSTRRYNYIEHKSGRILGKKAACPHAHEEVHSWHPFLFLECSYCFCLCDEISLKSDRFFNLRDSLSDVANNKVVTGLRFVKKNRVFHLQIQEGTLKPRSTINATSLSWQPVASYQIFDRSVHEGIDYHTLSYESRAIDLDDIYTDDNAFVVTGVRFRVVGAHLNLEARLSEFDFETGKLLQPMHSFWISNDNTEKSGEPLREELKLVEPDISTRCIVESLPDSKHNQYMNFAPTSIDKDVAQTTIPFIDTQEVTQKVAMPLSGVGIYHKGRNGYGGYIAPKLITYNFRTHMKN